MALIKNVALIGKGLFGSVVLPALVDAGFNVTVFSRSEKNKDTLPAGVAHAKVDYESVDSMTEAFRGQDAIVSTIGFDSILAQKPMIDAAVAAGVKRFIPADYTSFSTDPTAAQLPQHLPLKAVQTHLQDYAHAGRLEYTIVATGVFLEFLIDYGFAVNLKEKSAQLWGEGDHPVSATSLAAAARAVAAVLKNPEETKNRAVFVHELAVSQAKILALGKEIAPAGTEWTVAKFEDPNAEFENRLQAVLQKPEMSTIMALIVATLLSGQFKAQFGQLDNDLLGVRTLTEDDLKARVASALS
ncbi:NmrA-like family protein [Purpureocillium lilacinum]|uniref:NmrA-like family protein n=1 Tax=Purpureocillium lilacinum TaxID=33203 RepID=A0A179GI21_PURLI|nr:NmrA-like family protein [Purpureocillium lilacinum]OAQ77080.1 NmrA-like family protein [Purpureocillium lilacinum]OAQ85911.1 NmrA-like family protein [Purpureocillium lilacinum]